MPPEYDNSSSNTDYTPYHKGSATKYTKTIPPHRPRQPTHRILQLLIIIVITAYSLFFLCHRGTVLFCFQDHIPCPKLVVNESSKWKFWRRKKMVEETPPPLPPPQEELYPICPKAHYALTRMRSVLPLLENVILVGDMNSANTCPKPATAEGQEQQKGNKGLFHREIALFKKHYPGNQSKKNDVAVTNGIPSAYEIWTTDQMALIRKLGSAVRETLNDGHFEKRMKAVAWSGDKDIEWWTFRRGEAEGELLLGYTLKIMKWPKDLKTTFPFKPCSQTCPSTRAILHTLQYREEFRPWLITSSVLSENAKGFIYHHGHSPNEGPSLVWFRPGLHKYHDTEAYLRALVTTLEFAVTDSLRRSDMVMGQFNVIMDAGGFKLSNVPNLDQVKRLFVILQDHFPNRLGHLFVANLSTPAQLFMKILLPFVTEEVRKKIHIVPNDVNGRRELLHPWIGEEFVPDWLGGGDSWRFDVTEYYKGRLRGTEEEGRRYLTTMPYHA